jgi:hypothetical protein
MARGAWDEAIRQYREALREDQSVDWVEGVALVHVSLGRAWLTGGGLADAAREFGEALEYAGDVGIGEPVIAVAALLLLLDQAAGLELRQVRTRGLRRDAGLVSQLAGGQRAATQQRGHMLARAGSPTKAAIMAMSGPAFIVRC